MHQFRLQFHAIQCDVLVEISAFLYKTYDPQKNATTHAYVIARSCQHRVEFCFHHKNNIPLVYQDNHLKHVDQDVRVEMVFVAVKLVCFAMFHQQFELEVFARIAKLNQHQLARDDVR